MKERVSHLTKSIELEDVKNTLHEVGFTKESYQSYSLRKLGTNEISGELGASTRQVLENFEVPIFRAQISVAQPGWRTLFHRDHENFCQHGFRGMAPLNEPVYMSYLDSAGNEIIYKLDPGKFYFVNIAKLHKGFNPSKTERRILMMQMASDQLIIKGQKMTPMFAEETVLFEAFRGTKIHPIWENQNYI